MNQARPYPYGGIRRRERILNLALERRRKAAQLPESADARTTPGAERNDACPGSEGAGFGKVERDEAAA
jgi:hypothetical protein